MIKQKDLVYKILKSIYRLKQAGKLWNMMVIKFFSKIGFELSNEDLCILTY